MKFSVRQDTDLSGDQLFAAVSDFPRMERMLIRQGVRLQRTSPGLTSEKGMAWELEFNLKGKARQMRLEIEEIDRPEQIVLLGTDENLLSTITMTVVPLAASKSRLIFEADIRPRTMRARLLLQTAKLGKANLERKFASKIGAFITEMTARQA